MSSNRVLLLLAVLAVIAVITMLVAVVIGGVRLAKTFPYVNDSNMPTNAKWLFWAAALYTISPLDLLPDPILIDDIGVLFLAARSIMQMAANAGLIAPPAPSADPNLAPPSPFSDRDIIDTDIVDRP